MDDKVADDPGDVETGQPARNETCGRSSADCSMSELPDVLPSSASGRRLVLQPQQAHVYVVFIVFVVFVLQEGCPVAQIREGRSVAASPPTLPLPKRLLLKFASPLEHVCGLTCVASVGMSLASL